VLTDLQLSAITDIVLACELFLLSGLIFGPQVSLGSARFAFGIYLAMMGAAAMFGAIDHGFLEVPPHPSHPTMQFVTRLTIVLASLALLIATCREYLPRLLGLVIAGLGALASLWIAWVVWHEDNFLFIAGGSVVVFLLMLALSLLRSIRGEGSVLLPVGLLLTLASASIAFLGGDGVLGLGLYGTLHVAAMIAAFVLFLGGRGLSSQAPS